MNIERINQLLRIVDDRDYRWTGWGWVECFSGMARTIARIDGADYSTLNEWLGVPREQGDQLTYLYGLDGRDVSSSMGMSFFSDLTLEEQKKYLKAGLTSLRDTGTINWR
jgi:hypothetical protein